MDLRSILLTASAVSTFGVNALAQATDVAPTTPKRNGLAAPSVTRGTGIVRIRTEPAR